MLVVGLLADALQALGVEGDVRDGALVWTSQRLLIRCQHVIAVLLFYPAANAKAWDAIPFGQAALLALAAQNFQCCREHKTGQYCSEIQQTSRSVAATASRRFMCCRQCLDKSCMKDVSGWRDRCMPALTL